MRNPVVGKRLFQSTVFGILLLFAVGLLQPRLTLAADLAPGCPGTEIENGDALRALIATANTNGEADTITLDSGCIYDVAGGTLEILSDGGNSLSITGNGASISGGNTVRVFYVNSGADAYFDNLLIINGSVVTGDGGGIFNLGSLYLSESSIIANRSSVTGNGGGIYNQGTLTLTNTEIASNIAGVSGGGLYNYLGTVYINGSNFYGNSIVVSVSPNSYGGGLYNTGDGVGSGTVIINNSSFSANAAETDGAGIYNNSLLEVYGTEFHLNTAGHHGAGIYNGSFGTLTVSYSSFTDNYAFSYGGGIYAVGPAILTYNTFSGNTAVDGGGGIYSLSGGFGFPSLVGNSAFVGNSADHGAGIVDTGYLTVQNSTFYDNSADSMGGGFYKATGQSTILNSTFSSNDAGGGGGIYSNAGTSFGLHVGNTIIFNNTGGDCSGMPFTTDAPNLGCGGSVLGDPLLSSPPVDPPYILRLLPGSPAIDAGDNAFCPATDQLGFPRPFGINCDLGAYEFDGTVPTATPTPTDTPTPTATFTPSGPPLTSNAGCLGPTNIDNGNALRDLIEAPGAANTNGRIDTITLEAGCVYDVSGPGDTLDILEDFGNSLTIEGNGATITGANAVPVFFNFGANLSLNNLTITGGNNSPSFSTTGGGIYNQGVLTVNNGTISNNRAIDGGGIYNDNGIMTLNDSTLSGNSVDAFGGGIANYGTLTLNNSAIANNSAANAAGGIGNYGTVTLENSTVANNTGGTGGGINNSAGTMTLSNSTVSGNSATIDAGGGIYNVATLTLTNSTLSGNSAPIGGGGILNFGTATLDNSIIANSSGNDCILSGGTVNASSSLIEDGLNCVNGTDTGNLTGDPMLGALTGNPAYHPLLSGSPAIDSGNNSTCLASDQRGATRPVDGDGDGTATCDLGSYEYTGPVATPTPTPYALCPGPTDVDNGNFLRNQIDAANSNNQDDTITLDPNCMYEVTGPGGTLDITSDTGHKLTIFGNGAWITGGNAVGVFFVDSGANLTLNTVGITGGNAFAGGGILNHGTVNMLFSIIDGSTASSGGGGISNAGMLTFTDSAVAGNLVPGGRGGGILNQGTLNITRGRIIDNDASLGAGIYTDAGVITINNSTFSINVATDDGGAIYAAAGTVNLNGSLIESNVATNGGGIFKTNGMVTLNNSTLSGNMATNGAGINNQSGGSLTLNNSTLSGNTASVGGGGILNVGTTNLNNSIVANSTGGGDCTRSGGTVNARYSLIEDGLSCLNGTNTSNLNGDPLLNSLSGGYYPLLPASIAIDTGDNSTCLATDQRGTTRPLDGDGDGTATCDMGSFEYDGPPGNSLGCPGPTNRDNGNALFNMIDHITNVNNRNDTITLQAGCIYDVWQNAPYITADGGHSLTINGSGATIQGGNSVFVLTIDNANVTFDAVTITGGTSSVGGGLGVVTGTVALNNSSVTGNSTGISNGGSLTLTNTTVSSNSNGGILSNGQLNLYDSTVRDNSTNFSGAGITVSGGTATLNNSTVSNNTAHFYGGGIFNDSGSVTLNGSTVSNNSANFYGGGISHTASTITLNNTTVSDNHSGLWGGGIYVNTGTALLFGSTVANSSALDGAGFYVNAGVANLNNSTVSNNTATQNGGGFTVKAGNLYLTNSTVSNNSASWNGGGFYIEGGLILTNSIVANSSGEDCFRYSGSVQVNHSLIEEGLGCVNSTNTNGLTGDPMLGALTGSPAYYPLLAGSPAIDAGTNSSCLATDQRGVTRPIDGDGNGTATCDLGAFEATFSVATPTPTATPTFTPTATPTTTPQPDIVGCPGPTNVDNGNALRSLAEGEGNGNYQPYTITLQAGCIYEVSGPGGALDINQDFFPSLTIIGNGATISGGDTVRVFNVEPNTILELTNLIIQDGNGGIISSGGAILNQGMLTITNSTLSGSSVNNIGGVIYNQNGSVTLNNSTLSGNSATLGAGIYNLSGTLTITNSTLSNNTADQSGGGIYMDGGTLTITNSTLSGNSAGQWGGGIYNPSGTVTLNNSTLSGNSATLGGGIFNTSGLFLNNTIVANSSGSDCPQTGGTINANYSLIEEGLGCVNGTNTGNLTGDPMLDALTGNPAYLPLLPSSPAIDTGSNALCPATDQRGAARPIDGDSDGTATCDIGAFEATGGGATLTPTATNTFTPTNTATYTPMFTSTSTATETFTSTSTETPSETATYTGTFTFTPTATASETETSTATPVNTETSTFTPTPSDTSTFTPTPTETSSATLTYTITASFTATSTDTPTFTPTPSNTATLTSTNTLTSTPTNTATSTNTPTFTPSSTFTVTPSPTASFTSSPTDTPTVLPTAIIIDTATFTPTPSHTASATATPSATSTGVGGTIEPTTDDSAATYPPPPDVPDAASLNADTGGVVRVGIPDVLAHLVNVRVLYQNGSPTSWFGAPLYDGGSIGIQSVLDLGILQAVDIFSPSGATYFDGGAVFCLRGTGTLIWMDASNSPRIAEIIGSYTVPEFPGFTCATLFEPGTLVLVSQNPVSSAIFAKFDL